jgi:DMSO/TMAO reductase YedYZ molybdopterin-dependent catalytic subunit
MSNRPKLPPGQRESHEFPRFGLTPFANRFPKKPDTVELKIFGAVERTITVADALFDLSRHNQVSDFHCVTTWSCRNLAWSGFRFKDFYERIVVPEAQPEEGSVFVGLRGQDGYRTCLPLKDLLADDVLLADRLYNKPLTVEHGAPLRLVTPSHYGYKNVKYIHGLEFCLEYKETHPRGLRFLDHPRARVSLEERGRVGAGWFFRHLYRPLINSTAAKFKRALDIRGR